MALIVSNIRQKQRPATSDERVIFSQENDSLFDLLYKLPPQGRFWLEVHGFSVFSNFSFVSFSNELEI